NGVKRYVPQNTNMDSRRSSSDASDDQQQHQQSSSFLREIRSIEKSKRTKFKRNRIRGKGCTKPRRRSKRQTTPIGRKLINQALHQSLVSNWINVKSAAILSATTISNTPGNEADDELSTVEDENYVDYINEEIEEYSCKDQEEKVCATSLTLEQQLENLLLTVKQDFQPSLSSLTTTVARVDSGQDSLNLENIDRLNTMKHILFVDLDNWSVFFQRLPNALPENIFVIGFSGGKHQWKTPTELSNTLIKKPNKDKNGHLCYIIRNPFSDPVYRSLLSSHNFQLMKQSGQRHDAADFALVLTFGKLHALLPKSIPFTIVSGDKGFTEIIHQLQHSQRRITWLNPHLIEVYQICLLWS
ncbi:unnamed protein product, partial [Didymodactylos carnosus]